MATLYERAQEAANKISESIRIQPVVGIVCGSGLGRLSDRVDTYATIPYESIPHFKQSTVAGHAGKIVLGLLGQTSVLVMSGRLHCYEGYDIQDTVFPIRVMSLLGVSTLILTNAAGGLNDKFNAGDLMIVNDHINIPGLAGLNPLKGPNEERFQVPDSNEVAPRFLALSDAYDHSLRSAVFKAADKCNIPRSIHEGTYVYVSGPTYESRAEVRYLKAIGGDAVGMSTVPEVVVARHCGMKVLAISLITNKAVSDPVPSAKTRLEKSLSHGKATHQEVIDAANAAAKDLESIVVELLSGGEEDEKSA